MESTLVAMPPRAVAEALLNYEANCSGARSFPSTAALAVSTIAFDSAIAATVEDLNKDASQALRTLDRVNPVPEQISN
jgi:hypothetical protein